MSIEVPAHVAAKCAADYAVNDNGCWISGRTLDRNGAAVMSWRPKGIPGANPVSTRVANAAWVHYHGSLPSSGPVRQSCGDYRCVNPEHLEVASSRALPPADAARLRELHRTARTVNGGTRGDDPRRLASVELAAELAALLDAGWKPQALGDLLGVTRLAIVLRVSRHGYRRPPPSQARNAYKGHGTWDVAS